jgi:hypothetical protein
MNKIHRYDPPEEYQIEQLTLSNPIHRKKRQWTAEMRDQKENDGESKGEVHDVEPAQEAARG